MILQINEHELNQMTMSSTITDITPHEAISHTQNGTETEADNMENNVTIKSEKRLLNYYVTESPGIPLTIFFSIQVR